MNIAKGLKMCRVNMTFRIIMANDYSYLFPKN